MYFITFLTNKITLYMKKSVIYLMVYKILQGIENKNLGNSIVNINNFSSKNSHFSFFFFCNIFKFNKNLPTYVLRRKDFFILQRFHLNPMIFPPQIMQ